MKQCYQCAAFTYEPEDWDTGLQEVFICEAACFSEDDIEGMSLNFVEALEIRLQTLYFTLSSLNNCPEFTPQPRRNILDLKEK